MRKLKTQPQTIWIVPDILFIDISYLSDIGKRYMLLLEYKSQSGRWFLLNMKWFKQENISKIEFTRFYICHLEMSVLAVTDIAVPSVKWLLFIVTHYKESSPTYSNIHICLEKGNNLTMHNDHAQKKKTHKIR